MSDNIFFPLKLWHIYYLEMSLMMINRCQHPEQKDNPRPRKLYSGVRIEGNKTRRERVCFRVGRYFCRNGAVSIATKNQR